MRKPSPAEDDPTRLARVHGTPVTAISRRDLLRAGCTGLAALPWFGSEAAAAQSPRSGESRRVGNALLDRRLVPFSPAEAPPDGGGIQIVDAPAEWDVPTLGGDDERSRGGASIELDLPQLKYSGSWNPRPSALRELGTELRLRTRLEPKRTPSVVSLQAPEVFNTPFLYIAGQGGFPSPTDNALSVLQRFLGLGGMLVFDDASGGTERGFRSDVSALIPTLVAGRELAPVPLEHVLYRSFYLIDKPVGRTAAREQDLGVIDEGRLKILFLANDLGGALARDTSGRYRWSCLPGGEPQREWAIRLGINVLLYATCTDYKSDPAHVETLLRSRRWR